MSRLFDQYLGAKSGVTPSVVNLAIDGETSTSFRTDAGRTPPVVGRTDVPLQVENTNYDPSALVSQETRLAQVASAEKAAGNTITDITITLGFNDVAALASLTPSAALAAIPVTLANFTASYAQDLTEIRSLAPAAHIFLLGYYNPFPADPSSPAAPIFNTAGMQLNGDIRSLAAEFGATYVDTAPAFVGKEAAYTYLAADPAGSSVPNPYGGVLPIGNVHPNAAGYSAIAQEVGAAAVPEPSAWSMMLLGTALLGAAMRGFRPVMRRSIS